MLRLRVLSILSLSLAVGCFPEHLACNSDADCPAPTYTCNVQKHVCHIPGGDGGVSGSSSSGASSSSSSSSTSSSSGSSSSSSSSTGGWRDVSNSPGLADLSVTVLAFSPDNAQVLYAAQNDSVCVTTNAGGSFTCHQVCSACSVTSLAAVPGAAPALRVLAGTSQEIYRSDDRGGSWTKKADTAAGGGGTLVAVDPDTPDVMAAITRNGHAYRSSDGGDTWSPAASPGANLTQIRDLMFSTHNLYASGTGGVFRAVPPVASWTQWGSFGTGAQRTLRDRVFQGTFYAVSSDRRLWKTSNEGGSFTEPMAGTAVGALDIQTPSTPVSRVLWVAGDRTVYRNTSDSGGFEPFIVDGNPNHGTTLITVMAVAPSDADVVAVAFNHADLVITTSGGR